MFILSLLIDKASAVYKYEVSSFSVTDRCVLCIFTPYLLSSVMEAFPVSEDCQSSHLHSWHEFLAVCTGKTALSLTRAAVRTQKRPFSPALLHPHKPESNFAGLQLKQLRVCCGDVVTGGPLSHQIILIRTVARRGGRP